MEVYAADKAMACPAGVQFPAEAMMGIFPFRHLVQTHSGAHPASYPMGTGGC